MLLLRCAFQYLIREGFRTFLVVLGLATAFGAAAFMYGAAGQVAYEATRSLRWVTSGADLWLVPPTGLRLDAATGLIVCDSRLSPKVVSELTKLDSDATLRACQVAQGNHPALGKVILYSIADPTSSPRVACSPDLWAGAGSMQFQATFDGKILTIHEMDVALPPRSIAHYVTMLDGPPSWLTINTKKPGLLTRPASVVPYDVRDTPQMAATGSGSRPILYPLTSSAGRFSAFSFDARFDALVVNGRLKSALGMFSRLVVGFGALVALTSSVLGLREKRPMIAVLTAHGITGEMIGILLAESAILLVASWLLGTALAVTMLKLWAFPTAGLRPALEGVAITTVFIPSLILAATIVAASRLLSVAPTKLLKEAFV